MAGLQERNGSFRALFRHAGKQYSVTLGRVTRQEAEAKAGAIDLLVLRIKQGLMAVPAGVTIEEFVLSEGKAQPPPAPGETKKADEPVQISALKEQYLQTHGNGAMEANSLATVKMHLGHFENSLGSRFAVQGLCLADLQGHVNQRA